MAVIHSPAENVFDEQLIAWILVQLKVNAANNFKVIQVYVNLQNTEAQKGVDIRWSCVDIIRKFLWMQAMGGTPFLYNTHAVPGITEPAWESFFAKPDW